MRFIGLVFLVVMLVADASGQRPPTPNPDEPVNYAAWLNAQFAVPESENAAGTYRRAAEALVPDSVSGRFQEFLREGWTDEGRRKSAEWIARNKNALALWRKAAAMAAYRFPYKNQPRLMHDAPLSEMRSLTKLAILRMWLNFERGRTADALADLTSMLHAVRHMETHPGEAPYLIGLAYRESTYRALLRVIGSLDIAACRQVLDLLRRTDREPGASDFLLWRIELYVSNQRNAVDEDGDGDLDFVRQSKTDPVRLPDGTTWKMLVAEIDKHARNCQRIAAAASYPEAERVLSKLDNPVLADFDLGLASIPIRPYDSALGMNSQRAKAAAYRSAVRLALTSRIFHAEHDRWPNDLDEAALRQPPDIRLDRFSGKDIGFRVTNGGPLIYSANYDGSDDGGRWPTRAGKPDRRWSSQSGDYILWPPKE